MFLSSIIKKNILLSVILLTTSTGYTQRFIRSELSTKVNNPWEITYGPDAHLWLTESGGIVSRVDPTNGDKTVVFTASDFFTGSPLENHSLCHQPPIGKGTLGLTLDPNFTNPANSFIYFVYSYNSGTISAPKTKFRIKRLQWDANSESVINDSNIINMIPTGYDHLGGRLLSIKQNNVPYLFLTIGDHGISEINSPSCYIPQSNNPNNFTQDPSTMNGKIHRFNMDGTIPFDNPIPNNSFYTRGHRNPQGLMYNSNLEILYDVEHGDRTDDEINVLYKGMNYGWKNVRGYHKDSSFPGEIAFASNYLPNPNILNDSLVEPLFAWCNTPDTSSLWSDWCTVAPSDGIYYGNSGIPEWTNSLLIVTLKDGLTTNKEVFQFKLDNTGKLTPSTIENPNPKRFFGEDQLLNGRLRDITFSPDGKNIYLINNGGTTKDKITVYSYIEETIIDEDVIQLFPNPSNNKLIIKGLNNLSVSNIKITTIHGSIVAEYKNAKNGKIDISTLADGLYILSIFHNNNVESIKFIKKAQ